MNVQKQYLVLYKEISIGNLYISDEGRYRFVLLPDIRKAESAILFREWFSDTMWKDDIPFFSSRIRNAERFDPDPEVIGYQTDHYRLVKIQK